MSDYKLPETAVHANPPMEGAYASVRGWHHPVTNELLVSVQGLLAPNVKAAEPVLEASADTVTKTPQSEDGGEQTGEPSATGDLFSFEKTAEGVKVAILAPNQHKYTKWMVNGTAIDQTGNEVVIPEGSEFTAKSSKGEFTGKV